MNRSLLLAALPLVLAHPAEAARRKPAPAALPPREAPSQQRMRATVEKLVSFGTRHSLSSATDPVRGIGAARAWTAAQFAALAEGCGGCITTERLSRRFTGPRAPNGVVHVIDRVLMPPRAK